MKHFASLFRFCCVVLFAAQTFAAEPVQVSGIYPHLAMFNNEGECGTGAVVPWADRLWVVTYAPHAPKGSSDKLYEITSDLKQIIRPESIGGTPANRMIHRESEQLFIGPYAIDAQRGVRAIPFSQMFGRPTGNARHLTDPAGKIYFATMEEGLYEVDVKTLAVKELWADEQQKAGRHSDLPGYHGKGLYSSQGRLIYANNGEHGNEAQRKPDVPSGVLAQWDGVADQWTVVRRNQFTEVTGPGGIYGAAKESDVVWSIGWDHRSLILMCLDGGKWHSYRLPKASHSYDGAHGWNTEWPRIRDIGEDSLLMTMHGMFWKFPKTFSAKNSAGIRPRSTYLKVIGDFCRWNDRIVFGCDDTAKNEFLNKRKAKGEIAAPQSQSNLWFVEPYLLDQLGPNIGRGGVWVQDDVKAGVPSDPFLFSGFEMRTMHLWFANEGIANITVEIDEKGIGEWKEFRTMKCSRYFLFNLSNAPEAAWVRVKSDIDLKEATAWFDFWQQDNRKTLDEEIAGVALPSEKELTGGILRARGDNKRTLHFVAQESSADGPQDIGLYTLDADLKLKRSVDPAALEYEKKHAAIPTGVITEDAASLIFTDDNGKRWRLPRSIDEKMNAIVWKTPLGPQRVCREVATERDLFNAGGIFYELPAENAGGFAKVRAVAAHKRQIVDFCSFRGLFVISGLAKTLPDANKHIIRSDDGKTALWVGAIDDIWMFGKPRGRGGPWKESVVKANVPSDPFLMSGFNVATFLLSHGADKDVTFRLEVDPLGTGEWCLKDSYTLKPKQVSVITSEPGLRGAWFRVTADGDCSATCEVTFN